jgi:predicted alternative tryptophan synthase beta-subunit
VLLPHPPSSLLLLLQVWQVRASYDAKPYRKTIMQTW